MSNIKDGFSPRSLLGAAALAAVMAIAIIFSLASSVSACPDFGCCFDDDCGRCQVCSGGSCQAKTCAFQCSTGQTKCTDFTHYAGCSLDNCCLKWTAPVACASGQICSDGKCVASCIDDCASGAKRCSNGKVQTCGNYDTDTCTEWGGDTDCPSGKTCSGNGDCVSTCTDDCIWGAKRCSYAKVQTCGNYDTDACSEWGGDTDCSSGKTCSGNGDCVSTCVNDCASGAKRCSNGLVQTCGDYDADTCTEWGGGTACANGKTCSDGECKCVSHASKSCYGTDLYWYDSCGGKQELFEDCGTDSWTDNYRCLCDWTQREKMKRGCSFDKCFAVSEWVNVENCATSNKKCDGGKCIVTCVNDCASGAKRCSNGKVQTCGNYDTDTCTEWGGDTDCPSGKTCSGEGQCITVCTNECAALGVKKCTGTGTYQECGYFNSGECLSWSSDKVCASGSICKDDGKCEREQKKVTVDLAGPAEIACQKDFTLTWTSANADTCTASGAWTGNKAVSGSEQMSAIDGSRTYTITCTGEDGSANDSVTVSSTGGAPVANAGEDKEVSESGSVALNGSAAGSGALVYAWTCNGGTLENASTASPTFKAPEVARDTYYVCTLNVSNDCGTSSDTANILVLNKEEKTFKASLTASPRSGCAPVKYVDLAAAVTEYSGSEGDFTYSFDCESDGKYDKVVTTANRNYTAVDLCDYPKDKTYTAGVKVENAAKDAAATATTSISTGACHDDHTSFSIALSADPDSGCAPKRDVDLTAKIATDHYDDEYTYYFDCENDGDWDKTVTTSNKTYTTAENLCDYDGDGTYTAKVKVVSDDKDLSGEDTVKIDLDDCGAGAKGNIKIDKLVSNLSDGTAYFDSVKASPGEIVSFKITVTAEGGDLTNVILTDAIPAGLENVRDIIIDGKKTAGNLTSGIELGDIDKGESKTAAFTANVAADGAFAFGSTDVVNTAQAECDQASCSDTDTASVQVQKTMVEGATTVSTGLTNNPFVDSFVIPGSLALLLIWLFRSKIVALEEVIDQRKKQYARYRSQKALDVTAAKLRSRNVINRFK